MKHLARHILAAALLLGASAPAYAVGTKLFTASAVESINASTGVSNQNGNRNKLFDNNKATEVTFSFPAGTSDPVYVQVNLKNAVSIPANRLISVMTERGASGPDGPTSFKVEISSDGTAWRSLNTQKSATYANFLYRGLGTREFSEPVPCSTAAAVSFKHVRFTLISTFTDAVDASGTRHFTMAELNLISHAKGEDLDNTWKTNMLLKSDYIQQPTGQGMAGATVINDFRFVNTRGIASQYRHTTFNSYCDWDNCFDLNGKWKKDLAQLNSAKITPPDYSYLTNSEDTRIAAGQHRQRTHVTEHIVYAMPGEVVLLIPNYGLPAWNGSYSIDFRHWYNYRTGGHVLGPNGERLLDFLMDGDQIHYNQSYGFFGFTGLETEFRKRPNDSDNTGCRNFDFYGSAATFYYPKDPYTDPKDAISFKNSAGGTVSEYVIAADFGHKINVGGNLTVDFANKTINEPTVNYRHIFRIRNGKEIADQISGSKANAEKYLQEHTKHITARAGVMFQTRLEFHNTSWQRNTIPGNYYYKKPDGSYGRIYGTKLQVQVLDTINPASAADNMFYFFGSANIPIKAKKGSIYYSLNGDNQSTNGELSVDRFVRAASDKTVKGRFLVKLVGLDREGNELKVYGTDMPVVVEAFDINFVDENNAFLVTESMLKNRPSLRHGRDPEIERQYGRPNSVINFDEYAAMLPSGNQANDYYSLIGGHPAWKWPLSWDKSQYSWTYNQEGCHSTYRIVENSLSTPWHGATPETGLWDRKHIDTGGKQRGLFYYVNASDDPGISTKLDINDICPGGAVVVTGWLSEFSQSYEYANLAVNLVAVMKDKSRKNIHTYTTGYVTEAGFGLPSNIDNAGKWMKFYCRFIPNLSDAGAIAGNIDHYEVEFDNNCTGSQGADYAVDDLRAYVIGPRVYPEQTAPLCDGTSQTDVRINVPFEVLLQNLGLSQRTNRKCYFYYTIIDKAQYDMSRVRPYATHESALRASMMEMPYNGTDPSKFAMATFFTQYNKNAKRDDKTFNKLSKRTVDGEDYLSLICHANAGQFSSSKGYQVLVYASTSPDFDRDAPHLSFNVPGSDKCAFFGDLDIKSASQIYIDGIPESNNDVYLCKNQRPMVQVKLLGRNDKTNELEQLDNVAYLDWYDGSLANFQTASYKGTRLMEALAKFREVYKTSAKVDEPVRGSYTAPMQNCLRHFADYPVSKLKLSQSSYVMGAVQNNDALTAIPLPLDEAGYTVCTSPVEVRFHASKDSPVAQVGATEINYGNIEDVGIRLYLRDLRDINGNGNQQLNIPLRDFTSPSSQLYGSYSVNDHEVYLVGTNDPQYISLKDGSDTEDPMLSVGRFLTISKDYVSIKLRRDFICKEGYFYKLRINLKPGGDNADSFCEGGLVVTLKIASEYSAFNPQGDEVQWSDDRNWERVYPSDINAYNGGADMDSLFRGQKNNFRYTYAPMPRWSRTIVKAGKYQPWVQPFTTTEVSIKTFGTLRKPYYTPGSGARNQYSILDLRGSTFEHPIQYEMIADGASKNNNPFNCIPFALSSAYQVYLEPNGRLFGQENLNYTSFFYDIDLMPYRWYTLSVPTQEVVAGDFYTSKTTARPTGQLFWYDSWTSSNNDRYAPAVYQRSWNALSSELWSIGSTTATNVAAKAKVNTWSDVFNQVDARYEPTHGFSIYVDPSEMPSTYMQNSRITFRLPKGDTDYDYYQEGATAGDKHVVLSRAKDSQYRLFDPTGNHTPISSSKYSKLFLVGNPFVTDLDMKKFLEANKNLIEPKYWIMTEGNQIVSVMDENGTIYSNNVANSSSNGGSVAPMQGFFVQTKTAQGNLNLTFNSSMMTYTATYNYNNRLKAPARNADGAGTDENAGTQDSSLLITALNGDGDEVSAALIVTNPTASDSFVGTEDAELILDSEMSSGSQIFTVASDMATSVNILKEIRRTELGVVAIDDNDVTTLTFSGALADGTYVLIDALDGTVSPITEDFTYKVKGTRGELYIGKASDQTGLGEISASSINVMQGAGEITVTTTESGLEIEVFDTLGRSMAAVSTGESSATIQLLPGIYVVAAADGVNKVSRKVIVK